MYLRPLKPAMGISTTEISVISEISDGDLRDFGNFRGSNIMCVFCPPFLGIWNLKRESISSGKSVGRLPFYTSRQVFSL
jgi:hypothetical protein